MRNTTLLASSCALVLSAGALAGNPEHRNGSSAQQQADRQNSQRQQQADPRRQMPRAENEQFSGRITALRTLNIAGHPHPHAIAKMQLANDRSVILDLGPVPNLREQGMRPRRGQQMRVEGQSGRIDDRPVLVVFTADAEGRTASMTHDDRRRQLAQAQQRDGQRMAQQRGAGQRQDRQRDDRRMQQRDGQRMRGASERQRYGEQRYGHRPTDQQKQTRVSGQLEDYRAVRLDGERERHVLAKMRTDDGNLVIMDLGTVSGLRQQRTRLEQGMQMQARGSAGRIDGMPVLVVADLRADDQRIRITDRSRQRSRPQTARQRDQQMAGREGRRMDQQMAAQHGRMHQQMAEQQGRPMDQRQGRQMDQQRRQATVVVMGELTALRDVDLEGVADSHRLMRIETVNGQRVVVDMGRTRDVEGLQLEQGDTVVVAGQAERIDQRPVIRAERIAEVARLTETR